MTHLNAQNFWERDLEDVESVFLQKGEKITDLPSSLDDRVPSQGSVLLNRTVNIDKVVKKPSLYERIRYIFN